MYEGFMLIAVFCSIMFMSTLALDEVIELADGFFNSYDEDENLEKGRTIR